MGRSKTLFLVVVLCLLLLSGCGGRGSGEEIVTTRSELNLELDAILLAAREAEGYVVPIQAAHERDRELRSARAAFPELASVHAKAAYKGHELHFAVSNDAPWLTSWKKGKLATGVRELDTVFQDFDATSVTFLHEDGDQSWFAVNFDAYLRANRAAGLFFGKSDFLRIASTVSPASSDTDIQYEFSAPETTRLTFTSGDTTTVLERVGSGSWIKK